MLEILLALVAHTRYVCVSCAGLVHDAYAGPTACIAIVHERSVAVGRELMEDGPC